jgi:peptide/nickel transport system permease protein
MLKYIGKRILIMIPLIILLSIIIFWIIQLPPGDYVTNLVNGLRQAGREVDQAYIDRLYKQYGLDRPLVVQYFYWMKNLLQGNLGFSFAFNLPVNQLVVTRLPLTIAMSGSSLLFVWLVGFPLGVLAAVNQRKIGDYAVSTLAFIGAATPGFLLALILMWIMFSQFHMSVGGLFSTAMVDAPWGWPKFLDLLSHVWLPIFIIGFTSTAGLIRLMRANLLDEMNAPYVKTARAKGVSGNKLLLKYPIRIALIPFASTIGWTLPGLFSGETIVSIVMNIPTVSPLLFSALKVQDMNLAGSILLILSLLTIVGTVISDILLVIVDPRIRL